MTRNPALPSFCCWLLIGALAPIFGCPPPEPATEVLVAVDSDLRAGTELTELRVQVFDEQGKVALRQRTIPLSERSTRGEGFSFPLSYSLTPRDKARSSFRLIVTGRGPGDGDSTTVDRVEARVLASFRAGRRLLLPIFLARACLEQWCRQDGEPANQACMAGSCVELSRVQLAPAEQGELGGYVAERGGGRADGGQDLPRPACESDVDCRAALEDASPEGCAIARCTAGACEFLAADLDGDGQGAPGCSLGSSRLPGDDCDDRDPTLWAGAWDGPAVDGRYADGCDQRDNDCDGVIDDDAHEGQSCTCDPARDVDVDCSLRPDGAPISWPAGTPVGSCRYGKRSCVDGAFGSCIGAVEPAESDACQPDNDDDCDGQRNENCPCVDGEQRPCGSAVGSCRAGTQTCVAGLWSSDCLGAVTAQAADTCEPGNDDNCNGVANDGCTCVNGASSTCGRTANARGECASRPVTCVNNAWSGSCTTTNPELCAADNRDENCDGAINERPACACTDGAVSLCGFELGSLGDCFWGVAVCLGGSWSCLAQPEARDQCENNSDQNCNGIPHEGCACIEDDERTCPANTVPSGCTGGIQVCGENGNWGSCSEYSCGEDADG